MRLLPGLAAVAVLLAASGFCSPVFAGAKIIHVGVAKGRAHEAHVRPRRLGYGRYYVYRHYPVLVDRSGGPVYPYFHAWRPWNDRNYLRGPGFPPVNDLIQSHLRPGPAIPNAANLYRQRFSGGPTVEQGSPWASRFEGGKTVRQGSLWRSRIDY